ncbi:MAG: hypothetical protein JXB50_12710 [Spirochaetes bacterium]|nr:hypothetical protein [Spirochaetota bacterium]
MKRILRNIIGIIFIFIGILGGFIVFFQGWVFVLLGYILLDFKKKERFEEIIINFLNRYKFTKKLADFWLLIKKKNETTIGENKNKIRNIYHDIKKDIK